MLAFARNRIVWIVLVVVVALSRQPAFFMSSQANAKKAAGHQGRRRQRRPRAPMSPSPTARPTWKAA